MTATGVPASFMSGSPRLPGCQTPSVSHSQPCCKRCQAFCPTSNLLAVRRRWQDTRQQGCRSGMLRCSQSSKHGDWLRRRLVTLYSPRCLRAYRLCCFKKWDVLPLFSCKPQRCSLLMLPRRSRAQRSVRASPGSQRCGCTSNGAPAYAGTPGTERSCR